MFKIVLQCLIYIFVLGLGVFMFPFVNYSFLYGHYQGRIFSNSNIGSVPEKYSALVLGAGLLIDGTPSNILNDRVTAAVQLYKNGKVKKLIMSGDNREVSHNEPAAMIALAIKLGVPSEDIQPDYAGRRTYDSCWRAKNIFSQNDVIVVTQSFHLVRSLYICNELNVGGVGFMSDTPKYDKLSWSYWRIRDIYALGYSLKDIYIEEPAVVGGKKIDI